MFDRFLCSRLLKRDGRVHCDRLFHGVKLSKIPLLCLSRGTFGCEGNENGMIDVRNTQNTERRQRRKRLELEPTVTGRNEGTETGGGGGGGR